MIEINDDPIFDQVGMGKKRQDKDISELRTTEEMAQECVISHLLISEPNAMTRALRMHLVAIGLGDR